MDVLQRPLEIHDSDPVTEDSIDREVAQERSRGAEMQQRGAGYTGQRAATVTCQWKFWRMPGRFILYFIERLNCDACSEPIAGVAYNSSAPKLATSSSKKNVILQPRELYRVGSGGATCVYPSTSTLARSSPGFRTFRPNPKGSRTSRPVH